MHVTIAVMKTTSIKALVSYVGRKKVSLFTITIVFIFTLAIYSIYFSRFNLTRYNGGLWGGRHFKKSLKSGIKIAIWTSPQYPPSGPRLARMRRIVGVTNNKSLMSSMCLQTDSKSSLPIATGDDQCEFSLGHDNVRDVDAVVFFMFTGGYKLSELPTSLERNLEQIWVMYAREPPPLSIWPDPLHGLFNWTMSYRKDSDVWTPYGKTIPIISTKTDKSLPIFIENVTLQEWIMGKAKLVTGVISRCHSFSRRESLISEMSKTLKIDIYGGCGQPACGRYSDNCTEFWRDLGKQYKFYLAFENSLCTDYITEKFWRGLEFGMVPVVYGGGNYDEEVPPHSYIDLKQFNSTNELVSYLKTLDENDEEYSRYFEWRREYRVQGNGGQSHDWCSLCKALQVHKRDWKRGKLSMKIYKDLEWWWKHNQNTGEYACSKIKPFNSTTVEGQMEGVSKCPRNDPCFSGVYFIAQLCIFIWHLQSISHL